MENRLFRRYTPLNNPAFILFRDLIPRLPRWAYATHMIKNDRKLKTVRTIPVLGLHALLDTLICSTARTLKQGNVEPSHKTVATIALLIKTIKDAESFNETISSGEEDTRAGESNRDPLSPAELRARLTRYLKRLDDAVSPDTVENNVDDDGASGAVSKPRGRTTH